MSKEQTQAERAKKLEAAIANVAVLDVNQLTKVVDNAKMLQAFGWKLSAEAKAHTNVR